MNIYRLGVGPQWYNYEGQWDSWLPRAFQDAGFNYYTIPGDILDAPDHMFDHADLMYQGYTQLQRVVKLLGNGSISEGDSFFIDNIRYPGSHRIKQIAQRFGVNVNLYGYLPPSHILPGEEITQQCVDYDHWISYDLVFLPCRGFSMESHMEHGLDYERQMRVVGMPWNVWETQGKAYSENPSETRNKRIIYTAPFTRNNFASVFLRLAYNLIKTRNRKDLQFLIVTRDPFLAEDAELAKYAATLYNEIGDDNLFMIKTGRTPTQIYQDTSDSLITVVPYTKHIYPYPVLESFSVNTPVFTSSRGQTEELFEGLPKADYHAMVSGPMYIRDNCLDYSYQGNQMEECANHLEQSIDFFSNRDKSNIHQSVLYLNDAAAKMAQMMAEHASTNP
jgi:hypothetical protein